MGCPVVAQGCTNFVGHGSEPRSIGREAVQRSGAQHTPSVRPGPESWSSDLESTVGKECPPRDEEWGEWCVSSAWNWDPGGIALVVVVIAVTMRAQTSF